METLLSKNGTDCLTPICTGLKQKISEGRFLFTANNTIDIILLEENLYLFDQLDNFFMMLENGCVTSDDEEKQYCYYMLLLNESSIVTDNQKAIVTKLYGQVKGRLNDNLKV